jgi:hypothetical protein
MKKIQFVLLFILVNNFCNSQKLPRADALMQIAKNYFRSDPFDREFSKFLNHLMNDPTLVNKTIHKSTDTTYFYLRGDYTTHSPFFFKAKRIQIILAETELSAGDSLQLPGTMMTYQLAGYVDSGKEGEDDVKKEFERFDRKYLKKFQNYKYSEIKNGNEVTGAIRNYFIIQFGEAPLSAAWQKFGGDGGNVFVITLRFKVSGNEAVLPVPADSP